MADQQRHSEAVQKAHRLAEAMETNYSSKSMSEEGIHVEKICKISSIMTVQQAAMMAKQKNLCSDKTDKKLRRQQARNNMTSANDGNSIASVMMDSIMETSASNKGTGISVSTMTPQQAKAIFLAKHGIDNSETWNNRGVGQSPKYVEKLDDPVKKALGMPSEKRMLFLRPPKPRIIRLNSFC